MNVELLFDGMVDWFDKSGDDKIVEFLRQEKETVLHTDWILEMVADVVDYVSKRVEAKNTFYGVTVTGLVNDRNRNAEEDY
jgi:hypothetical protein